MKYILGISAYYHDTSVCLFKDGELIFACEEEKFSGIKHDDRFPKLTLKYLISEYGINNENLEKICFYENPKLKWNRVWKTSLYQIYKNPIFSIRSIFKFLKNRIDFWFNIRKFGMDKIVYTEHHLSHLYYSSATSPYKKAVSLSLDGVGEWETAKVGLWEVGRLKNHKTLGKYPHSIGLFYSAMTSFLGFRPNEGEYKVMGLSAYGNRTNLVIKMKDLIWLEGGEIRCNLNFFNWHKSDKVMFNHKLVKFLGIDFRLPNEEIKQIHKDLAWAVQNRYEEILFQILNLAYKEYKCKQLTLGGGCAYNGLANGKIYSNSNFVTQWIPPAPSDAGSAIGSTIKYLLDTRQTIKIKNNPFLGPTFKFNANSNFKKMDWDELYKFIAKEISNGKVIGWYHSNIEFGARALGHRSILADPTSPIMKDRINKLIKRREGFRPFAPMVAEEYHAKFFNWVDDVPYMNQVVEVRGEYRDKLKSITHIDGTARVQTVYKDNITHPLLLEFEKITRFPILLNTSFNIKDKTIVLTPDDAIETFFNTDIDILVINQYILEKKL
jgi:carbamoyltransferase